MVECDIKDECGEVLFPKLCNQRCIEKINISKNGLATKTSTALC